MVITDIKIQKHNESRYNIFIDSKFCFSAGKEDIIKFTITKGKEIEEEELLNLISKCEETEAYDYALVLLGIKDYSSKDMRKKLIQKQYSNQTIDFILSKLQSLEFINDERYAEKYIEYCLSIKKSGRNKIMYDLQNKGINASNIESLDIDEEKQFENACNLALKKMNSVKNTSNPREKVIRYLLSRGYEFDLIKKVVNKLFKDIENEGF